MRTTNAVLPGVYPGTCKAHGEPSPNTSSTPNTPLGSRSKRQVWSRPCPAEHAIDDRLDEHVQPATLRGFAGTRVNRYGTRHVGHTHDVIHECG